MNALSLYVTTCRMVFQADVNDAAAWSDINRLIMYLRQALTCNVCRQLLTVPMSSSVASCQHHVCRSCIGGKMRLKPSCSWCKDYSKFIENIQLRLVLQCYKRLALYIKQSDISKRWATLQTGNTPGVLIGSSANSTYNQNNNCPTNFKDLIDEGSNLPDKYTFFEPPSLRNLNRSSASLPQQSSNSTSSSSLNSTSLENSLANKPVQPTATSLKAVKKDADPLLKLTTTQATIVRLTTTEGSAGNPLSNPISSHPLHNHANLNHPSSLTLSSSSSLNSINPVTASSLTPTKSKQHKVRKGCRCGLATLNPGKLTCCGQRCPCYVEGKACVDCRCRGCRNPNKLNSSHDSHSKHGSNLLTSSSPILITSAINISTNNLTNNASSLISTSPGLFSTSNLPLSNSSNQTTLLSSPAGTRNLLSPSFLLSSSPSQTPSSATLISNSNQMLRGASANLFQTGTKFNVNLISTTSSPYILGHHNNVGSVSTVDSLTLPFPTIESIEDQVILSGTACIEEDASSLHQIIN